MRALALALCLAAAAACCAVPASADPPRTCGRLSYGGSAYVIRAHRVTCGFALKSAKRYLAHKASPHGFRCRSYAGAIPVYCQNPKHKSQYLMGATAT
jgi:hypothetical protein